MISKRKMVTLGLIGAVTLVLSACNRSQPIRNVNEDGSRFTDEQVLQNEIRRGGITEP